MILIDGALRKSTRPKGIMGRLKLGAAEALALFCTIQSLQETKPRPPFPAGRCAGFLRVPGVGNLPLA